MIVKALRKLGKVYDPQFLFLSEIKNKDEKLEDIRRKMKSEKSYYVELEGLNGGLVVWWKEQKRVRIVGKCKNVIDMEGNEEGSIEILKVFWVYGLTNYGERHEV